MKIRIVKINMDTDNCMRSEYQHDFIKPYQLYSQGLLALLGIVSPATYSTPSMLQATGSQVMVGQQTPGPGGVKEVSFCPGGHPHCITWRGKHSHYSKSTELENEKDAVRPILATGL